MVNNNVVSDLEELLMDFFEYRKVKKAQNYTIQSHFDTEAPLLGYSAMNEKTTDGYDWYQKDKNNGIKADYPTVPGECDCNMDNMKTFYGDVAKRLHPCVDEILNGYDHEHSSIYSNNMSRENLVQISDAVIDYACNEISELKGLKSMPAETDSGRWDSSKLLRCLVDSLVLCEVYARRGRKNKGESCGQSIDVNFFSEFPYPSPYPYI